MRVILIAVLTCIATALAAQSPPPSPTNTSQEKQEVGRDKSSPAQEENRPSASPKSTFDQANSEPSIQTRKTARSEDSPKSWFNYNALAVTVFTGVLALVAWLQLKAMRQQAGYMRDGLTEAKKAADAAKESAKAAIDNVQFAKNTERAFVLMQSVPVSRIRNPNIPIREWITFNLKNWGRTMANSVQVTGRFFGVGGQLPFPDIPTTDIAPQGVFQWVITTESMGTVLGLKYEVTVTYVDVFENPHTYHCQGRYEPSSNEFVITGSSSD